MTQSPPDAETLRKFALGDLPPAEWDRVARYLESHPGSPDTLVEPAAEDTFVSALRAAPGDAPADSPELRSIIDAAAKLVPDAATAVFAQSVSIPFEPTAEYVVPPKPGERLGRFRLERVLGRGGMGVVYAAADEQLDRRIALKVMAPQLAANPVAKERFLREARTAARVEHDNIVPILEVGEDRGVPFMAMPLLRGRTLDERLAEGTPDLDEALAIARGMTDGLAAAHDRGLIHRDIKPSNVWLEAHDDGSFRRVRIFDFGLARQETDADRVTKSGTILGTPAYMAPEQARGEAVDARADLFSLGCVLYRMTTGQNAFRGSDTYSLLTSLAMDRPKAPSEINADIPRPLSQLIMDLLEKDAKRRPANARAVRERLAAVANAVPAPSPRRGRALPIATIALSLIGLVGVLFGGTIVRIATNKGELVVEVNDDNVEIVVKQDGAVVVDKTKDRRFVLTAKDGEIEFLDPETGVTTQTKTFRLTRGGVDRVTATMAAKGAAAAAAAMAPPPYESDDKQRTAMEWVINSGGRVYAKIGDIDYESVPGVIKKLPSGKVRIRAIQASKTFSDLDISRLKDVVFYETEYFGSGEMRSVLELRSTSVTSKGISELATYPGMKGLRSLKLGSTKFGNSGIKHLNQLTGLRELDLGSTIIDSDGISALAKLGNLQFLSLAGCDIRDEDLATIKTMTKLMVLELTSTPISSNGIKHLVELSELKSLGLHQTKVDDAGLRDIKKFKNLRNLDLRAQPITDQGLLDFEGMDLQLNLGGCRSIRGPGLAHLQACSDGINLENTTLDDPAIAHLAGCKKLRWLNLIGSKVTETGVRKLAASIPQCTITWSGGVIEPKSTLTPSQRQALEALLARGGQLGFLRAGQPTLYVTKGESLPANAGALYSIAVAMLDTDTPATILGILEQVPPGLKSLNMHYMPFTGADLEKLVAMPNLAGLESLAIPSWKIVDDDLRQLRMLTKLNSVSVNFTPSITAAGIAHLRGLPLESLQFQECPVDDTAIDTILRFRDLRELGILNSKITAKGLARLPELTKLYNVSAGGPSATEAALRELARCPNIGEFNLINFPTPALAILAKFPNLQVLALDWNAPPTPEALAAVGSCPRLRKIRLYGKPFTAEHAKALAALLPATRIDWPGGVVEPSITDDRAAVNAFLGLGEGSSVQLKGHGDRNFKKSDELPAGPIIVLKIEARRISDAQFDALVSSLQPLRNVVSLKFDGSFRSTTLASLSRLAIARTVSQLSLINRQSGGLVDADLSGLAAFPALAGLDLNDHPRLTGQALARLKNLPRLERLSIADAALADVDLADLPKSQLRQLEFVRCGRLTDAGIATLAKESRWTTLSFWNCTRLSDASLMSLAGVATLTKLDLRGTQVTAEGVKAFAAAVPGCRVEWNGGVVEPKVSADAERALALWVLARGDRVALAVGENIVHPKTAAELPKDAYFVAEAYLGNAGDADLAALAPLWRALPRGRERTLHIAGPITNAGLGSLRGCPIVQLVLNRVAITDEGLPALAEITGLNRLQFDGTRITDAGLAALAKCPSLVHVDLLNTAIGDAGLRKLAELPNLHSLTLTNTTTTAAGLDALAQHAKLQQLTLSGTVGKDAKNLGTPLGRMATLQTLNVSTSTLTDADVRALSAAPITMLRLASTRLTDKALDHLAAMKSLETLHLEANPQLSRTAVQKLAAALAACRIHWSGGTIEPQKK